VLAIAGIARPEKFFATLEGIGAIVAGRRRFADHHLYDPRDIAELAAVARRRGLMLVTTEKDYVRLAADQRAGVRALPVTLRFEAPERVAQALAVALAGRRFSGRSTP
jgi:tetraacyldisaccharide 4'-kinase